MDSYIYRHLLGQLNKTGGISHHNIPSHNLLSLETLLEVSEDALGERSEFPSSFPCYQPFPYSVQTSSVLYCGSRQMDDATQLLNRKISWERKLKTLKMTNINLAMRHIKEMRQNKVVKVSKSIKKYIEHFQNDPEPMFSGYYNWLYTGSSLSCDTELNDLIILSPDYCDLQPGFNILKCNQTLNEVQQKFFTRLKCFSPVLQISCKSKQDNLIICVRQKKNLSVFVTKKCSQPVKLWKKKVLSPKLLISADVKTNCEEIIVSDSNYDLHSFNIERKNKMYGHTGKKIAPDVSRTCWSQVAFGELGIYWAFQNCFSIVDVRDTYAGVKFEYVPYEATNNCEEICSFIQSSLTPYQLYLGTTHSVLQMDLRNGKPVQRWTHLMKSPPQFMTCINNGERNEILFLQSQSMDEISGIVNEFSGECSFISKSLPCLLKSMKESLKIAHFNGICLSPVIGMRMDYAVTGMQCLRNEEGEILLLTNNSGGDIFRSKIINKSSKKPFRNEEEERETIESMKMYESHSQKFPIKNSISGHFEYNDMSHLLPGLKQGKIKGKVQGSTKPTPYWKYHEMYAPESLRFFKDLLAPKILKVWGHSSDVLETEEPAISVDSKVRDWMSKC